jgi:hypothetical protein
MLPGADQTPVKGSAGRFWVAPISFSTTSNVTVGCNSPCRPVGWSGSFLAGKKQTHGSTTLPLPSPSSATRILFYSNYYYYYYYRIIIYPIPLTAVYQTLAPARRRAHDTNQPALAIVWLQQVQWLADAQISVAVGCKFHFTSSCCVFSILATLIPLFTRERAAARAKRNLLHYPVGPTTRRYILWVGGQDSPAQSYPELEQGVSCSNLQGTEQSLPAVLDLPPQSNHRLLLDTQWDAACTAERTRPVPHCRSGRCMHMCITIRPIQIIFLQYLPDPAAAPTHMISGCLNRLLSHP